MATFTTYTAALLFSSKVLTSSRSTFSNIRSLFTLFIQALVGSFRFGDLLELEALLWSVVTKSFSLSAGVTIDCMAETDTSLLLLHRTTNFGSDSTLLVDLLVADSCDFDGYSIIESFWLV